MHLKNLENTHRPFCSGLKMKNLEYNVLNARIANIVDIIVTVILGFSLIRTECAAVCRVGIHPLQNLILAPKKITIRLEDLALFVELTRRYKMIKRMEFDYNFDYNFWGFNPYVLNKGEEAFCKLANKFNISIIEQTEIKNQAKDDILYALIKAYQENKNPLKDSEPFLLANLINQYKLDNLIEHICRKYNLNESDFYHDAYHDGSYLKVEYQNKLIA